MTKQLSIVYLLAGLLFAAACGPGRTAAATQPTPAAFDATASDPKAIAAVDAMLEALGGAGAWAEVKQVQWDVKYTMDGQLKAWVRHAWDIWNGRHRCELADMSTLVAPNEENPSPDPPSFSIAMYDLFAVQSKAGHATYGGKEVDSSTRDRIKGNCFTLWQQQSYQLAGIYKLKDPGVKLEHVGELRDVATKTGATVCSEGCDSVKVTFAPEVGKDTYWVHISKQSKLPVLLEKQVEGGRLTYVLTEWVTVKGLKFPQKHQNAGLPGEVFTVSEIKIGDPDDRLYIPQVR